MAIGNRRKKHSTVGTQDSAQKQCLNFVFLFAISRLFTQQLLACRPIHLCMPMADCFPYNVLLNSMVVAVKAITAKPKR